MRSYPTLTMCAYLAVAATASLAPVPAAAQSNVFIKFEGVDVPGAARDGKGGGWIEINSVQWAAPQAGGKGGNVEFEWKVEEGESAPPAPGGTAKFGAVSGAHRNSDMTMKGSKIGENAPAAPAVGTSERLTVGGDHTEARPTGDPDRPLIAGNVPNASGRASSRRQHRPVTITKEWGAATPQMARRPARGGGSLVAVVPAGLCQVGARYPAAELGSGGRVYRLEGVTVTACAAAASGRAGASRPMESLTLNYAKIEY